jgi:hypothetical protein
MKSAVSVQNQDTLHQKQAYPTEHGKTVNNDQWNNLPGDLASSKTLAMGKE